jgi:hypothetical protein
MIYFPEKNMYKLQEHVSDTHSVCPVRRERSLVHTVGVRAHWYTQQFKVMLSLCRMMDPVALCPKLVEVVQALVASMAAESLLTIPWGC